MLTNKSELLVACEVNQITMISLHKGVSTIGQEQGPAQIRDEWNCTISYQGKSASFEYFSGIGNRKLASGVKPEGLEQWRQWRSNIPPRIIRGYKEAIRVGILFPVHPTVADVLYCVLNDSNACYQSFVEWCENFGLNPDSIRDQEIYFACQKNGDKIRRLLGTALCAELQSKEH